jgi:hypothetical protein
VKCLEAVRPGSDDTSSVLPVHVGTIPNDRFEMFRNVLECSRMFENVRFENVRFGARVSEIEVEIEQLTKWFEIDVHSFKCQHWCSGVTVLVHRYYHAGGGFSSHNSLYQYTLCGVMTGCEANSRRRDDG